MENIISSVSSNIKKLHMKHLTSHLQTVENVELVMLFLLDYSTISPS